MTAADGGELAVLGAERYVRLTTFRRDGRLVPTPVWVVPDDAGTGDLLVTTTAATGKVKRLGHTPRVQLAPCDARGRVAPGATEVEAHAEVLTDPGSVARVRRLVGAKYRLGFVAVRLVHGLGAVTRRVRRRAAPVDVAVRIRPAPPAGG